MTTDWPKYNEALVRRGEILLDPSLGRRPFHLFNTAALRSSR